VVATAGSIDAGSAAACIEATAAICGADSGAAGSATSLAATGAATCGLDSIAGAGNTFATDGFTRVCRNDAFGFTGGRASGSRTTRSRGAGRGTGTATGAAGVSGTADGGASVAGVSAIAATACGSAAQRTDRSSRCTAAGANAPVVANCHNAITAAACTAPDTSQSPTRMPGTGATATVALMSGAPPG